MTRLPSGSPAVRAGWLLGLCLGVVLGTRAVAQAPAAEPAAAPPPAPLEAATLWYANRPIVDLRGSLMARTPAQRVSAAAHRIDQILEGGVTGPVTTRPIEGGIALLVGSETVLAVLPGDVDGLQGESLDLKASVAAMRLQEAMAEAVELRTPGRLFRAVGVAAAATALLLSVLWLLVWLERFAGRRVSAAAERQLARVEHTLGGQVMRVASLSRGVYAVLRAALALAAAGFIYVWLAFVLRRFPYTRPLGESLRTILLERLELVGAAALATLPNLFTVAVIFIVARMLAKVVKLVFAAVERGRLVLPGVYPDTALASRRLTTALLWLFTLAVAYPYVPGSNTSGFQGISVFVGVILSLGSTGVVQHLMSGLMLTFARALRVGDFARVGDVEGTVTQIGGLATKFRTPWGEEVTIPNAVLVSQTMTNYSRMANERVPLLTTSVTIGYDTPWRQVEALLLEAAARTPGVCRTPAPVVWRVGLEDYYIKHTLMLTPERPTDRPALLDQLHSNILDAFNEAGVQIMSPHYMMDPASPKVVPAPRPPLAPPSLGAAVADTSVRR